MPHSSPHLNLEKTWTNTSTPFTSPVVVFTSALFFSCYAIQQRTLRELRAAIRPEPRPSPKIFLPDRFRKTTTELPDGTIVVVDDGGGGDADEQMPRWMREKLAKEARAKAAAREMVVEVRKTVPGEGGQQKVVKQDKPASSKKKKQKGAKAAKDGQGKEQWDKNLVPNPDDASKKPVSRAERRRLIKEEIKRLSQNDRPTYYQRRLW